MALGKAPEHLRCEMVGKDHVVGKKEEEPKVKCPDCGGMGRIYDSTGTSEECQYCSGQGWT